MFSRTASETRLDVSRLHRLSRRMEWVTSVGVVLIVGGIALTAAIPSWCRNLLLARLGETGARLPLGASDQLMAGLIVALPVGVMIWGLVHVRALFREFADGMVFTSNAAHHLQRFGVSVLAQGVLGPLSATLLALALSFGNPPGERYLVLTLSINDYFAIIVGGVLVAVAAALREAARLADENASFI